MAQARTVLLALVPCTLSVLTLACAPDRDATPSRAGSEPAAAVAADRPGGGGAAELAVVAVRPGVDASEMFLTFLEPAVDAPVPARTAGIVQSVPVREGQRVARGQVLARLENEEQRLEVEYTGALAAQAAAELERAEKGARGEFISRQQLDASRAKAQATRVDLELAKLALERRTLRAPVAGVVWQVRAEPHRLVAANEVLFRVSETSRLRGDLLLPAAVARGLAKGDALSVDAPTDPGVAPATARVTFVSPLADPATGRVRVGIETRDAPAGFVGQSVRVRLSEGVAPGARAAAGGALLPRGAHLERDGGRMYVRQVRDGRVARSEVVLGASRPDGYEVLSGLAVGDLVCAAGAVPPADGTPVTPRLVAEARP